MTSPVSAAAPNRRASSSPQRRTAKLVLIVGTVISLGLAFGPAWAARIGIAIAIVAAVVACVLTWRELWLATRTHASQLLSVTAEHGKALTEERTRNAGVVDCLTERVREHVVVIEGQKVTIAQLKGQVSSLRGDNASLRRDIVSRDSVIGTLRDTVRAREAELAALLADHGEDAEVHTLPRRVRASHDVASGTGERRTEQSAPRVVDLIGVEHEPMVLPNFEGARKLA